MNKLWIITIIGAVLFAGWIIWALPSLRKLRRVFPYAFTFALLAAVFVFLLGWFGILGPPSEPIGGTPQDYEIWQARCMAAYGRSMVALLIMTVTYAVATFGILWNSLIEKNKEKDKEHSALVHTSEKPDNRAS